MEKNKRKINTHKSPPAIFKHNLANFKTNITLFGSSKKLLSVNETSASDELKMNQNL